MLKDYAAANRHLTYFLKVFGALILILVMVEVAYEMIHMQMRGRAIINDENFRHHRMLIPALKMADNVNGHFKKISVNDLRIIDSRSQLKYNQETLYRKDKLIGIL